MKKSTLNYDHISQIYDSGRTAHPETVEKLVRLLGVDNNSWILDMGCGTGNYTRTLHQITKNILGLDLSEGMLTQARAKYPEIMFLRGDITAIPFESEAFDGAFAVQVLHHVKEKEQFLREAYRILRKRAYIALHACSHSQMRAFWFYHYFPEGLQIDLTRMPDAGEIAALLGNAGFVEVGVEVCYQDVVVANETPRRYLEKSYRDSISTFAFLNPKDIEFGCRKIVQDIESGEVENIIRESESEVAYHTGGSCIIYGQK